MSVFKLARKNFLNNVKAYRVHLLAMIFSVATFYNFATLKYNPKALGRESMHYGAKSAADASTVLLVIFLAFFIFYSNSVFLKQRKKEIGMYCFMGVTTDEIGMVYFFESLSMGITSFVFGIVAGVLTNKLFLMLLGKFAMGNVRVPMFISYRSILHTGVYFVLFFFAISFIGFISIKRSKLIDLFNAAKKEDKPQKISKVKGVLSLIIIGGSYFFISDEVNPVVILKAPIVVIVITWGTFWLFQALIPGILNVIKRNKRIYYKGNNILAVSNLVYRVRKNYRSLTAVAILIACSITAFGTSYSMKYVGDFGKKEESPYDFALICKEEEKSEIENLMNEEILSCGLNKESQVRATLVHVNDAEAVCDKFTQQYSEANYLIMSKTDAIKAVKALDDKKANEIEKMNIGEKNIGILTKPGAIIDLIVEKSIKIGGVDFEVSEKFHAPLFGKAASFPVVVMDDRFLEELRTKYDNYYITGINIMGERKLNEDKFKKLSVSLVKVTDFRENAFYHDYTMISKGTYEELAFFFFIGGVLALVYIIASGAVIYFNIVSEAYLEKDKYQKLIKIGVTEKELWSVSMKQGIIQCLLPLLIGIIHAIVALRLLSKMMLKDLLIPGIGSVVLLSCIYLIFYIFATRKFLKVVVS